MYRKFLIFFIDIVDFFHKKKIIIFFKKFYSKEIQVFFDVGAHHGETINIFKKNFDINEVYSFEASPKNFEVLKKNINHIFDKKFKITLENKALSSTKKKMIFKQTIESSSSTLSHINMNSEYYKKKEKIINFFSKKNFFEELEVYTDTLESYIKKKNIFKIDILKIDTEGHELQVILGLKNEIKKIKFILFEHHFDNMIVKNYSLRDINNILVNNNFKKIFKAKMPFRKSFEYIYINNNFNL